MSFSPPAGDVAEVECLDDRFRACVVARARLEPLVTGARWLDGPVWLADQQALLVSDLPNDRVLRVTEGGGVDVFRQPARYANGHARDLQGRLLTCSHGRRALLRTEPDGRETVLAESYEGRRLNAPHDVAVHPDGSIWFTDSTRGIDSDFEGQRAASELPPGLWRFDPHIGWLERVDAALANPAALAFSPDGGTLYVVDIVEASDGPSTRTLVACDVVDAAPWLRHARLFPDSEHPVDAAGLCCDDEGRLWAGGDGAVHCLAPEGALLGRVRVPGPVTSLCFGGATNARLFLCAGSTLFALSVRTRGVVPAFRPGA
jgi:gluconolactonase